MYILGIESSCDETAAAVVLARKGASPKLISSAVSSQVAVHRPYGGIVPELASRSHIRFITEVIAKALRDARLSPNNVDAVAATAGPGLPGSLLVGLTAGKAFAWLMHKPFVAVNHTEAHISAAFLQDPRLRPPLLALVASGGHTELILMKKHGSFEILGRTRDDAAGEAYDKVARLLKIPYPGGPGVEKMAGKSQTTFRLPIAKMKNGSLDFSFSGLKTAVAMSLTKTSDRGAIARGFQTAVIGALVMQTREAIHSTGAKKLILAGGVAANSALRQAFAQLATSEKIRLVIPQMTLCTDNAAMIACAGWFRLMRGHRTPLSASSDPSWTAGTVLTGDMA